MITFCSLLYSDGALVMAIVLTLGMGRTGVTLDNARERRVFVGGVLLWPLLALFILYATIFTQARDRWLSRRKE